ncbi:MAG: tRNA uridine-5-carboxymethylaminomethyl(34) synthesis GTPase MnmE [Candidatus Cloacimonetes bacterium]|nr:tRNA uridine-5-carboxymethylaminomethyl(34) synthesis GTPase MnmE [Candidatus Cloacimonadota bacterium]
MKYIQIDDTIVALSTANANAAIAIIRISGEKSIEIVETFFKNKKPLSKAKANRMLKGKIFSGDRFVDDVMVCVYRNPISYTGEDMVEIFCHGNLFIVDQVIQMCLTKARIAEPGEFTQRAYLNNKIDLTQAEAINDLLKAQTKQSQRLALEQMSGSLFHRIEVLLSGITDLRTLLELEIDFVEQGLDSLDEENFSNRLNDIKLEMERLVKSGEEGIILREGLKISLLGSPNVGKSSIFNKFLQTERAIVTPVPGTTRDYLEEALAIEGYLVRFYDTAGLRETNDLAEKIGIQKSLEVIKNSDVIIFVTDNNFDLSQLELLDKNEINAQIIKVVNKSDLLNHEQKEKLKKDYVLCSTVEENGLDELKKIIINKVRIEDKELHEGILTNARQISSVRNALNSMEKAQYSFFNAMGYEFTVFDLKEASEYLEEIIGKVADEDILNKIFSEFCVGK